MFNTVTNASGAASGCQAFHPKELCLTNNKRIERKADSFFAQNVRVSKTSRTGFLSEDLPINLHTAMFVNNTVINVK